MSEKFTLGVVIVTFNRINGILYERKSGLFFKQCFSFLILLIKLAIKFPKTQREYQQKKKKLYPLISGESI